MAVPGLSGSNGGVGSIYTSLPKIKLNYEDIISEYNFPLDISYFVNNICNLKCKHCYVAYQNKNDKLNVNQWKELFNSLINMGALTFGNVGKEPLLSWETTKKLLEFLQVKRKINELLRFGLVTNGTLFNEEIINSLIKISPDYIDISLDGDKAAHDNIRGVGNFEILINNLTKISDKYLLSKIFIIYTINKTTIGSVSKAIDIIHNLGINNVLFSPYVTLNKNDELYLSDDTYCSFFEKMYNGEIIDFSKYNDLTIYLKNDYTTTLGIMNKLIDKNLINLEELIIDEYGVIFNEYIIKNNKLIFNYIPFDNSYKQMIRISHDGYIGNCFDMFFDTYTERTIGNIKNQDIREILSNAKQKIEEKELIYR
ncbi:MAG: radical SAM protein [Bacteroidales bacterium]|nr:radical SAM protein [Bacteroidales bacterium]